MDTTMVKKYSDAMDEVNSWLLNEAMDNMIESIHSKVSENEFDHLKNKLSDPEEDAGKCCKKYVECAEKCGRLEEAKTEIQRLLKIGVNSARIDMSNKEVRKVAENIVAQYAVSTKTQTQQLSNDDEIKKLFGEKVCNFITKLQSAKSEEEAVKLIESADDDDLNVNLKGLFMAMITSTAGGNAAKSQQQPKGKQTKQASNQKKKDTPNTKQQKKPTPAPSTNTTEPDIAQMILQAEPGQKLFTTTSVPQPQTV